MDILSNFLYAFVPMFVAMDPIGLVPMYMALTEDMSPADRRRVANQSLVTALAVALLFIFLGSYVLGLLGITVSDFLVAGGALLFILATMNMVTGSRIKHEGSPATMGAVPLGTPLIVGPAVLTMALILVHERGHAATVLAVLANAVLVRLAFYLAEPMTRLLGKAGSQAVSKVVNLLLAAFAVMMIRRGLPEIVKFIGG